MESLRLSIASLLMLCLVVSGCGRTGKGMLAVQGTVKYEDGEPVSGEVATIVFSPDRTSSNPSPQAASGTIGPDGAFVLMTHQPDDGAFAGDYKVVLKVWSDYRSQESPIPREYGDESATPLSATVDKDNRKFDFSVPR